MNSHWPQLSKWPLWIVGVVVLISFGLAVLAEFTGGADSIRVDKSSRLAPVRVYVDPLPPAGVSPQENRRLQNRFSPENTNRELIDKKLRQDLGVVSARSPID